MGGEEEHSTYEIATGYPDHGGWVSLRDHLAALRESDMMLQAERDRRYAEVNVEKEKALKIKETADLAALQLAREIQTYKDEQANNLRSQIESERGSYVTQAQLTAQSDKLEALIKGATDRYEEAHKPIVEFMTAQLARTSGVAGYKADRRLDISQVVAVVTVIVAIASVIIILTRH